MSIGKGAFGLTGIGAGNGMEIFCGNLTITAAPGPALIPDSNTFRYSLCYFCIKVFGKEYYPAFHLIAFWQFAEGHDYERFRVGFRPDCFGYGLIVEGAHYRGTNPHAEALQAHILGCATGFDVSVANAPSPVFSRHSFIYSRDHNHGGSLRDPHLPMGLFRDVLAFVFISVVLLSFVRTEAAD